MDAQKIIEAARAECGTELSKQAIAVINAICGAISLENQALVRMNNAVETKTNGCMKRPDMHEVVLHGAKIGLPQKECMRFYDHYEANGWRVGKVPMKLWTAALSNWKRTWLERNPQFQSTNEVSFRDVKNVCREKYGDCIEWMSWASQFYNYWAKRKWLKDGKLIDWQAELSSQVARWRNKI